ncbi:hypothetical protein OG21DRAFT_1500995 [Imleria badia]|nr:hypothetical protein OG21DRAFT_1500995 [Imleria badia]
MADVLLAIQIEKLRVEEALVARDNVVAHLEDAYISVRQKAETILRLEQELEVFKRASTPANTNSSGFECVLKLPGTPPSDPGQTFEELEATQMGSTEGNTDTHRGVPNEPPFTPDKLVDSLQSNSAHCRQIYINSSTLVREAHTPITPPPPDDEESQVSSPTSEATPVERTIAGRQAMLATLPLPSGIPDDALQPIVIQPPHTLHEFLGNVSGSLKDLLQNYRVLSQPTTYWCPDREEHGYFLTPIFKCSTNPRVTTAHRWSTVDVIGQMNKPTECFYNKDGKWYYAGTYKAFRMDDLTVQEWESLSSETTQAIVRETLVGRKNVSPQNHYETSQLYAAGALRVACIGLRCVGFSDDTYRGVLEQSRFLYWGRSTVWTPVRTAITLSETTDDTKSTQP